MSEELCWPSASHSYLPRRSEKMWQLQELTAKPTSPMRQDEAWQLQHTLIPNKGNAAHPPFPLSAWIQIFQDAQRKLTQHWLPKAHTHSLCFGSASLQWSLWVWSPEMVISWHLDPQGGTGVSPLPTTSWLNLSCPCQSKKKDVKTWMWDWFLLSHQGIFCLSDTDLGLRPIPASPVCFLWLGNNSHLCATELQSLFPPICQNTML